ncbi:MAG: cupin domain-containing protein [Spirochaetes bacterium]|nr:cupin domain-containing protein [Spirochaetota bacterium]
MAIINKEIAQRIKEIREINGVSEESISKEFNIGLDLYKKYESGEIEIPVSLLSLVSSKFNIDITSLLTGEEPKLRIYCVVRKDSGPEIDRRKEYKYRDLSYNFINKKAETFLVTVESDDNKDSKYYYSHAGQEFNYVLEGALQVNIGKHEVVLNEGDSLYFDSSYKHSMKALNKKTAKFLAIIF